MNYLVNLDKFYGPLDLLLYLLEKEEMDIYDIPIAIIADQYIEYVHSAGELDLDRTGDFLIMASYLLNLKSRLLLPGLVKNDDDEAEMNDPREELVFRILEYKKYKEASELLASRFNEDTARVYFRHGLEPSELVKGEYGASLTGLLRAWRTIQERFITEPNYNLPQDDIDVSEKMALILTRVPRDGTRLKFTDLYAGIVSRREGLAFFLALLELIRLQKVEAWQEERFGDIQVFVRVAISNADE
jgi:segregation and condensation protein A